MDLEITEGIRFFYRGRGKFKSSQFHFDFTVLVFRLRECL